MSSFPASRPSSSEFAEDPVTALEKEPPALPSQARRFAYVPPDDDPRSPTDEEMALINHAFRHPDDRHFHCITSITYRTKHRCMMAYYCQLRRSQLGAFHRTTRTNSAPLSLVKHWLETTCTLDTQDPTPPTPSQPYQPTVAEPPTSLPCRDDTRLGREGMNYKDLIPPNRTLPIIREVPGISRIPVRDLV